MSEIVAKNVAKFPCFNLPDLAIHDLINDAFSAERDRMINRIEIKWAK